MPEMGWDEGRGRLGEVEAMTLAAFERHLEENLNHQDEKAMDHMLVNGIHMIWSGWSGVTLWIV